MIQQLHDSAIKNMRMAQVIMQSSTQHAFGRVDQFCVQVTVRLTEDNMILHNDFKTSNQYITTNLESCQYDVEHRLDVSSFTEILHWVSSSLSLLGFHLSKEL